MGAWAKKFKKIIAPNVFEAMRSKTPFLALDFVIL
jgi:hypothetical protein